MATDLKTSGSLGEDALALLEDHPAKGVRIRVLQPPSFFWFISQVESDTLYTS